MNMSRLLSQHEHVLMVCKLKRKGIYILGEDEIAMILRIKYDLKKKGVSLHRKAQGKLE